MMTSSSCALSLNALMVTPKQKGHFLPCVVILNYTLKVGSFTMLQVTSGQVRSGQVRWVVVITLWCAVLLRGIPDKINVVVGFV